VSAEVRAAQVRRKRGLSQATVARRIGISQSGISSFERHCRDPLLETVVRYAKVVGAELTFVMWP